jgi:hypothetical protein
MFTVQHVLTAAISRVVGFMLILMFMPETKSLSLEELDAVFSVSTRHHAMYQLRQIPVWFRKRCCDKRKSMNKLPCMNPFQRRRRRSEKQARRHKARDFVYASNAPVMA